MGSIPEWGRTAGGEHGNPLQYSCLENSMNGGACRITVRGIAKSWTQLKQLSMHTDKDYSKELPKVDKNPLRKKST